MKTFVALALFSVASASTIPIQNRNANESLRPGMVLPESSAVASADPADNEVDGVATAGLVSGVTSWLTARAESNPGCIERFVCETYRTGETLSGVPYAVMQMTNAAVSFMVADVFDKTVDAHTITKAARHGRTAGTCTTMKCDLVDTQLRSLEALFGPVENFLASVFGSLSGQEEENAVTAS